MRLILRDQKSTRHTMLCPHWQHWQSGDCDREVPDGLSAYHGNNEGHCWLTQKHSKPAGPLCCSILCPTSIFCYSFVRWASEFLLAEANWHFDSTAREGNCSVLPHNVVDLYMWWWPTHNPMQLMSCDATRYNKLKGPVCIWLDLWFWHG